MILFELFTRKELDYQKLKKLFCEFFGISESQVGHFYNDIEKDFFLLGLLIEPIVSEKYNFKIEVWIKNREKQSFFDINLAYQISMEFRELVSIDNPLNTDHTELIVDGHNFKLEYF